MFSCWDACASLQTNAQERRRAWVRELRPPPRTDRHQPKKEKMYLLEPTSLQFCHFPKAVRYMGASSTNSDMKKWFGVSPQPGFPLTCGTTLRLLIPISGHQRQSYRWKFPNSRLFTSSSRYSSLNSAMVLMPRWMWHAKLKISDTDTPPTHTPTINIRFPLPAPSPLTSHPSITSPSNQPVSCASTYLSRHQWFCFQEKLTTAIIQDIFTQANKSSISSTPHDSIYLPKLTLALAAVHGKSKSRSKRNKLEGEKVARGSSRLLIIWRMWRYSSHVNISQEVHPREAAASSHAHILYV